MEAFITEKMPLPRSGKGSIFPSRRRREGVSAVDIAIDIGIRKLIEAAVLSDIIARLRVIVRHRLIVSRRHDAQDPAVTAYAALGA